MLIAVANLIFALNMLGGRDSEDSSVLSLIFYGFLAVICFIMFFFTNYAALIHSAICILFVVFGCMWFEEDNRSWKKLFWIFSSISYSMLAICTYLR